MSERRWAEPFFNHTYAPIQAKEPPSAEEVLDDVWAEKADAYNQTKDNGG